MVACVVEERATLRAFAQFSMHDRLALCFMRTIISVKQVPIMVVEADQSGARLRAGAQPISGDYALVITPARSALAGNTKCGSRARRNTTRRRTGGRDANQLSRGPLLRPPPARPVLWVMQYPRRNQ
jgi:hypothetical protein